MRSLMNILDTVLGSGEILKVDCLFAECLVEYICAFVLMFVPCIFILRVRRDTVLYSFRHTGHHFYFVKGITQGLLLGATTEAFGNMRCGYGNPAVTLGAFVSGEIRLLKACVYFAANLLACINALDLFHVFLLPSLVDEKFFAEYWSISHHQTWIYNPNMTLYFEYLGSFVVVLSAVAARDLRRRGVKNPIGIGVGFTCASISMCLSRTTGGVMNPAKALALFRMFPDSETRQYPYIIGPFFGGMTAGIVYRTLLSFDDKQDVVDRILAELLVDEYNRTELDERMKDIVAPVEYKKVSSRHLFDEPPVERPQPYLIAPVPASEPLAETPEPIVLQPEQTPSFMNAVKAEEQKLEELRAHEMNTEVDSGGPLHPSGTTGTSYNTNETDFNIVKPAGPVEEPLGEDFDSKMQSTRSIEDKDRAPSMESKAPSNDSADNIEGMAESTEQGSSMKVPSNTGVKKGGSKTAQKRLSWEDKAKMEKMLSGSAAGLPIPGQPYPVRLSPIQPKTEVIPAEPIAKEQPPPAADAPVTAEAPQQQELTQTKDDENIEKQSKAESSENVPVLGTEDEEEGEEGDKPKYKNKSNEKIKPGEKNKSNDKIKSDEKNKSDEKIKSDEDEKIRSEEKNKSDEKLQSEEKNKSDEKLKNKSDEKLE